MCLRTIFIYLRGSPQKEKDIDCSTTKIRSYHGNIVEVFGWDETAYVVMKLCHTVDPVADHEEGYNALDNHCEAVKFDSAPDGATTPEFSFHWLELHLPEVESTVHLTQFHPDWRRKGTYLVNAFDNFNVLNMGDVQRDHGAETSEDLSAEAFDEYKCYPQDIGGRGEEGDCSEEGSFSVDSDSQ
jgi:hypothetical protein